MANCPNCGHNPRGLSTSWMWIYQCNTCGRRFCHKCGSTTSRGVRCPCGSDATTRKDKCHG